MTKRGIHVNQQSFLKFIFINYNKTKQQMILLNLILNKGMQKTLVQGNSLHWIEYMDLVQKVSEL